MGALRLFRMLAAACGLAVLMSCVTAAFADAPAAASPLPEQVAKAPPPPAAKTPEAAPAKASAAEKGVAVAQLTYPVPAAASATELLQAADDYAFYADWEHQWQYLQQVVSSYPGSKEAGRALALLADHYAATGDQAQAAALNQELATYGDAEVQAFASLVRTVNAAERAQQYDLQTQALAAYAKQWRGTATGGWVALRLGDVYRFSTENFPAAIATFRGILADYRAGPVAEEAAVSLAESVNWSGTGDVGQAIELYQAALDMAQDATLRRRALAGLGDCYEAMRDWTACWDTLSLVINGYSTHPAAAHAAIIRAHAAQQLGYWQAAVEDAKLYLASTNDQPFWRAYANDVLAEDAFRAGRYDEAEGQFALVCELAEKPQGAEFRGAARAGIAACLEAKGDRRSALTGYLDAADHTSQQRDMAVYLYEAALLAQSLGDSATFQQIADRMVTELPGSHLTTKLVGHEVLPAPEI